MHTDGTGIRSEIGGIPRCSMIARKKGKVILTAIVVAIVSATFSGYCLYRFLFVGPQLVGSTIEGFYEESSTGLAVGLVFMSISLIKIWLEICG
jgi:hypothetical protein